MFCPNCGTSNAETNRFCLKCGQPLTPPIVSTTSSAAPIPGTKRQPRKWIVLMAALILIAVSVLIIWWWRGQSANLISADPTELPAVTQLSPLATPATQPITTTPTIFNSPQATPTKFAATPAVTRAPARSANAIYLPAVLNNLCPSDVTPYGLTSNQLSRLGCPAQDFVTSRRVIIQRFENGVMVLFAKPGNVFDKQGGGILYALAADGRAWKLKDIFAETTSDRRSWYDCDAQSSQGPEVTGVPWRSFGKVWCAYPDIKQALGKALSREETGMTASFQSFELGRAFKVSDWRSFPGWSNRQVILAYLPVSEGDYIPGVWEIK